MRKKSRVKTAGFTIVELILYMGILSMVLFVLTQTFVSIVDLQLESEATSSVEQDSRYLLSRLTYDIKRAGGVITPATPGQSGNNLQLTINGSNIAYSLNGQVAELTSGANVDRLNSPETRVSSLNFTRLGNPGGKHTIKIEVTVESRTILRGGFEVKNLETTVGLR